MPGQTTYQCIFIVFFNNGFLCVMANRMRKLTAIYCFDKCEIWHENKRHFYDVTLIWCRNKTVWIVFQQFVCSHCCFWVLWNERGRTLVLNRRISGSFRSYFVYLSKRSLEKKITYKTLIVIIPSQTF